METGQWIVSQKADAVGRWWEYRGLWRAMDGDVAGCALLSTLKAGLQPIVVSCSSCGFLHTDVGYFAVYRTREKLCGGCGELFKMAQRCVGNAYAILNPELTPDSRFCADCGANALVGPVNQPGRAVCQLCGCQ